MVVCGCVSRNNQISINCRRSGLPTQKLQKILKKIKISKIFNFMIEIIIFHGIFQLLYGNPSTPTPSHQLILVSRTIFLVSAFCIDQLDLWLNTGSFSWLKKLQSIRIYVGQGRHLPNWAYIVFALRLLQRPLHVMSYLIVKYLLLTIKISIAKNFKFFSFNL